MTADELAQEEAWLEKELDYLDANEDDRRLIREIVHLSRELLHGSNAQGMAYYRDIVVRLVQGKNVAPLTDDPLEWVQATPSMWQSKRNPDGYSTDGGRTHWFLSERVNNRNTVYTSIHYTPPPLPPEPDPIPEPDPVPDPIPDPVPDPIPDPNPIEEGTNNANPDLPEEAVPGGGSAGDGGQPDTGGGVVPGGPGN